MRTHARSFDGTNGARGTNFKPRLTNHPIAIHQWSWLMGAAHGYVRLDSVR